MIGVGVAQLYPNLTLSGLISTVAASAAKLGTAGTVSWSFGPTIDFAIFEGGKRRAQVAVYRSQASQGYLAWKSTVLAAVGEVEKALTAYGNERKRKASLEAAVPATPRRRPSPTSVTGPAPATSSMSSRRNAPCTPRAMRSPKARRRWRSTSSRSMSPLAEGGARAPTLRGTDPGVRSFDVMRQMWSRDGALRRSHPLDESCAVPLD